ncbi:MAG: hypothetical protein DRI61_16715, partial [Chloroflexi bacterium]
MKNFSSSDLESIKEFRENLSKEIEEILERINNNQASKFLEVDISFEKLRKALIKGERFFYQQTEEFIRLRPYFIERWRQEIKKEADLEKIGEVLRGFLNNKDGGEKIEETFKKKVLELLENTERGKFDGGVQLKELKSLDKNSDVREEVKDGGKFSKVVSLRTRWYIRRLKSKEQLSISKDIFDFRRSIFGMVNQNKAVRSGDGKKVNDNDQEEEMFYLFYPEEKIVINEEWTNPEVREEKIEFMRDLGIEQPQKGIWSSFIDKYSLDELRSPRVIKEIIASMDKVGLDVSIYGWSDFEILKLVEANKILKRLIKKDKQLGYKKIEEKLAKGERLNQEEIKLIGLSNILQAKAKIYEAMQDSQNFLQKEQNSVDSLQKFTALFAPTLLPLGILMGIIGKVNIDATADNFKKDLSKQLNFFKIFNHPAGLIHSASSNFLTGNVVENVFAIKEVKINVLKDGSYEVYLAGEDLTKFDTLEIRVKAEEKDKVFASLRKYGKENEKRKLEVEYDKSNKEWKLKIPLSEFEAAGINLEEGIDRVIFEKITFPADPEDKIFVTLYSIRKISSPAISPSQKITPPPFPKPSVTPPVSYPLFNIMSTFINAIVGAIGIFITWFLFSRVFSPRTRWYIWRLRDEDWRVRKAAAEALGRIGSQEAVPYLQKALKDEKAPVRQAAAYALGRIGSQKADSSLIEVLKDEKWYVRQAAAEAL